MYTPTTGIMSKHGAFCSGRFCTFLIGLVALIQPIWMAQHQNKRPHIVVIVVDDLGWNDVSFHGSPQIPTPNMDALASDGLLLDNYYVMPICTPSRSALLTGYHPIHTGMQHNVILGTQPYGLPLNLTLLPQHLQQLGYATHAVGKWHLGFFQKEYTPTFRGFDTHFGYWLGHCSYYDHTAEEAPSWGLDLRDNLNPVWNQGGHYATELFTKKAVDVIKQHNVSQPLFLYLAHLGVHGGNGYSVLESPAQYTARFPHIHDTKRRLFAGMVSAVDDSVGQVFRALSEERMLDNCLVVLTTDNGGATAGIDASVGSNWPLRGVKYTLWQGGVKGTAALWQSRLKPGRRNQLMHIVDWMPTLYSAAGGNTKDLGAIDGVNMWPSLSHNQASPRTEALLNIDPIWQVAALVSGDYKLVSGTYVLHVDSWYGPSGRDNESMALFSHLPSFTNASVVAQTLRKIGRPYEPPSLDWYRLSNLNCSNPPTNLSSSCLFPEKAPCLFNLKNDPCEYHDIAKSSPHILAQLETRLEAFRATAVPPANKPADPRGDPSNFGFLWSSWV